MIPLLADAAIRSLILGVTIGLGLALFRVRNPAVKSLVWTVVLIASLAMPALIESARALTPTWAEVELPYDAVPQLAGLIPVPAAANPVAAAAEAPPLVRWQDLLVIGYGLVAMGFVVRLLVGMIFTWQLAQAANPVPNDIPNGGAIRLSPTLTVPVTFGQTILLPFDAPKWSQAKRTAVLAHEQAHIARGDFYTHLLSKLNRAIFWFSPFAWWLDTELAALAETASDDAAVRLVGGPLSYAEILVEVAGKAGPVPAGVAMARTAGVGARVERILAGTVSHPVHPRIALLIIFSLIPWIAVATSIDGQLNPPNAVSDASCASQLRDANDSEGKTVVQASCWHIGPVALGMSRMDVERILGKADYYEPPVQSVDKKSRYTVAFFLFPRDLKARLAAHPMRELSHSTLAVIYADDRVALIDNAPPEIVWAPKCQPDSDVAVLPNEDNTGSPPDFARFAGFAGVRIGNTLTMAVEKIGKFSNSNDSHDFYRWPFPVTMDANPDSSKVTGFSIATNEKIQANETAHIFVSKDPRTCLVNGFKMLAKGPSG